MFTEAIAEYLEDRKIYAATKSHRTDKERSRALKRHFGKVPLGRISAQMITKYQKSRIADGISGRTINLEVGLLRRILKRHRQWLRLSEDVKMLNERPKPVRALEPKEKDRLLEVAASKPEWQVANCAAVLALNTTMRGCELRGLQWMDVNLFERALTVRRYTTKTDAGARVIPINQAAYDALVKLRARGEALGGANPDHYVFPACEHGNVDVTRPAKGWRTAWRKLTTLAGLKGLRFHDLRHHAITELAELGLSDQTIMSIAGHVSREMLNHYSHIRLDAKRKALDALNVKAEESVKQRSAR